MTLLSSALAALAVLAAIPVDASSRLPRAAPPRRPIGVPAAAAIAAVATGLLLGWPLGPPAAVAVALGVRFAASKLESAGQRRTREQLERQAPELADLVAALLAAGLPTHRALRTAAAAIGPPAGAALEPVIAAIDLGAADDEAWRAASGTPLEEIGASIIRSAATGAPTVGVLEGLADDLRRRRRLVVEVQARSAGVRAVAPLAMCFLPSFFLLGLAPVVASLATGLL